MIGDSGGAITLLEDVLLQRNNTDYLVDPLRLNLHFNASRYAALPASPTSSSSSPSRRFSSSIDMDDFLCEGEQ